MSTEAGGSVPALVRRHRTLLRDAAAASALLAALYLLGTTSQSDALVLPLYFLFVAIGIVEELLASAGVATAALGTPIVAVTLLALGSIGAGVVHLARTRVDGAERSTLGLVLAAPLAVVGALALLVAVSAGLSTSQVEPVVYTGAVAAACLVLAALLSGVVDPRAALGR